MEMTLRWLKRSRDYFEAHKEEVVWLEDVSVASGQLPQSQTQIRVHYGRSPAQDATG